MRTTITLDDDVSYLIAQYRKEHNVGLSGAVNELLRQRSTRTERAPFVQHTSEGRARIDVGNVGDVLAMLDENDR